MKSPKQTKQKNVEEHIFNSSYVLFVQNLY